MPKVARLGDPGSHGGVIITASDDVFTNSIGTARVGDIYGCPIHGPNPIVTGSDDTFTNDRRTAHVGSLTACGAVIVDGSPDTWVNEPLSP